LPQNSEFARRCSFDSNEKAVFLSDYDKIRKTVVHDGMCGPQVEEALVSGRGVSSFVCIESQFNRVLKMAFSRVKPCQDVFDRVQQFCESLKTKPFIWEVIRSNTESKTDNETLTFSELKRCLKKPDFEIEDLDLNKIEHGFAFLLAAKSLILLIKDQFPLDFRTPSDDEWDLLVPCQQIVQKWADHKDYVLDSNCPLALGKILKIQMSFNNPSKNVLLILSKNFNFICLIKTFKFLRVSTVHIGCR